MIFLWFLWCCHSCAPFSTWVMTHSEIWAFRTPIKQSVSWVVYRVIGVINQLSSILAIDPMKSQFFLFQSSICSLWNGVGPLWPLSAPGVRRLRRGRRHGCGLRAAALGARGRRKLQISRASWLDTWVVVTGRIIPFTIWLFNIAMENGPFIDGLPIKNGDFPWRC